MSDFYLCFLSFYYKDRLYKVVLFKKKIGEKKETVVYYLTSENPTSKVRLLAFTTRSFVISFFIIIFFNFLWRRVRDLKNSYLEASLSQAELMGITLFCQNPKEKLYTFPPSLFLISLLYVHPHPQLLTQNENIFIIFFLLLFKERGKERERES